MNILFMRGSISPVTVQSPSRHKDSGLLPLTDPRVTARKRDEIKRVRQAEKWVHAVPVIIFLCFFILWWFCRPVSNLEMIDFGV